MKKILSSLMSMIGSGDESAPEPPPDALHQERTVDEARAALAAAEREHAAAQMRRGEAETALAAAEGAYDQLDSDQNGEAVIQARQTRDLAILKVERTAKRVDAARAALGAAERAAERAALDVQLATARSRLEAARRAEATAAESAERAHPATALRLLADADRETPRAALAAAIDATRAAEAEIGAIEAELVRVAPELADQVNERQASREAEERAGVVERATVMHFRRRISKSVATIVAAKKLIAEAEAEIDAAIEDQRNCAKLSGGMAMHTGHRSVHVYVAEMGEAGVDLSKVRQMLGATSIHMDPYQPGPGFDVPKQERLELYLSGHNGFAGDNANFFATHRRALAARDAHAIRYEAERRARAEGGPPPPERERLYNGLGGFNLGIQRLLGSSDYEEHHVQRVQEHAARLFAADPPEALDS